MLCVDWELSELLYVLILCVCVYVLNACTISDSSAIRARINRSSSIIKCTQQLLVELELNVASPSDDPS